MKDKINIEELEMFLKDEIKNKDTKVMAQNIADFLKDKEITSEKVDTYTIYQTMEGFETIEEFDIGVVTTDNIEDALDKFCEENGDTWMYDINTLTCSDDYGNEVKFAKEV